MLYGSAVLLNGGFVAQKIRTMFFSEGLRTKMAGLRQKELLFAYWESARKEIMLCGETNKKGAIWWRSGGWVRLQAITREVGSGIFLSVKQLTYNLP